VKSTYDARTDALSIILKADATVTESNEEKPGVILDYDAEGDRGISYASSVSSISPRQARDQSEPSLSGHRSSVQL